MQTIQARWYHKGRQGETPRLIVVHCTVSRELGTGAEAVAKYFSTSERKGSTQLVADNNSVVRCVDDDDTCFGAAGANRDGLHLELVGMPDQSAAQWVDEYSIAELEQAGPHIRAWSDKYEIPLRWLTVAQVADGHTAGLCTHADVSAAFPKVSTGHWDPGPNFSKARVLAIWRGEDDEEEPTVAQIEKLLKAIADLDAKVDAHAANNMPRIRQFAVPADKGGGETVYVVHPGSLVGIHVPYDTDTNHKPLSQLFSYGIYPADGFHTTTPPEEPIGPENQSSTLFIGGPLASPG